MDRYITAEKLIEILKQLPPESKLTPNAVGNLAVWYPPNAGGMVDAAIDFRSGELERY